MLQVLKEQCKTCIFLPGNQMGLRPGRVAGMLQECKRTQAYIPCHETMEFDDEDEDTWGNPNADGPICRGFFDAAGEFSQQVRIAERLGAIEFIDQPE